MSLPDFPESRTPPKAEMFYIETASGDSYALIENITKVNAARFLMRDLGFIDYEDVANVLQSLDELERKLRARLRDEFLEPAPEKIEAEIIRRVENKLKRETNGKKHL